MVEDNADLTTLWKLLFTRAGMTAHFDQTGVQALKRVNDGYIPDVLLTDFHLADMTGADVILSLSAKCPNLKCFVLSGDMDLKNKLPEGTRVLLKPVSFDQLMAVL